MCKFNVGDIVIGNANSFCDMSTENVIAEVVEVYENNDTVICIKDLEGTIPYQVPANAFDLFSTRRYFEEPLQVMFFDGSCEYGGKGYEMGIAYEYTVICGCCGAAIPIDKIYDDAEEYEEEYSKSIKNPIIPLPHWASMSEYLSDWDRVPSFD